MREPMRLSPILALVAVALGAGCTSSTPDAGNGSAVAGTGSAPVAPPRVPPKGAPDDSSPPVDITNDPAAQPCTGKPGELYALTVKKLTTEDDVPLCRFAGKVLMIVNVASHCGYTPQYAPLQALYAKYAAQGFYVLGFPSRSFDQEFSDAKDVSEFCTNEYKITFPMFGIANVNAPDQQPVYTWLKAQPGFDADIPWNFEKWLITRQGKVAKRIDYTTSPDAPEVAAAIESELSKP